MPSVPCVCVCIHPSPSFNLYSMKEQFVPPIDGSPISKWKETWHFQKTYQNVSCRVQCSLVIREGYVPEMLMNRKWCGWWYWPMDIVRATSAAAASKASKINLSSLYLIALSHHFLASLSRITFSLVTLFHVSVSMQSCRVPYAICG